VNKGFIVQILRNNKLAIIYIIGLLIVVCWSKIGYAIEYTPLIDSGFLDGPKADVQTAATGFLAVVASIAGVGLIIKVLTR
jgi:hypothetical protein